MLQGGSDSDASEGEGEEGSDDDGDDKSFASIDDLEGTHAFSLLLASIMTVSTDEGDAHLMELSKLAEKDPEFYKYLQENDRELLDFNPEDQNDTDEDEELEDAEPEDVEMERAPVLTKQELQKWQKALLEVCRLQFFSWAQID